MDISVYISELLFDHDCVIIPGFGGLICNYKPAEIEAMTNRLSPPSKAISFNKNLLTNDGLLVNYICGRNHAAFTETMESVQNWVESSKALLKNNEEVSLKKIGKIFADREGNIQFMPDNSVNYLKSSFGLRTIVAEPVVRERVAVTNGNKTIALPKADKSPVAWRIAAAIVVIACLGVVIRMMSLGVDVKPLQLDEANVLHFMNQVFYVNEKALNTLPVEMDEVPAPVFEEAAPAVSEVKVKPSKTGPVTIPQPQPVKVATPAPVSAPSASSASHGYYVIIGAFRDEKNVEAAKANLLKNYPESEILLLQGKSVTKIGYFAGTDATNAQEVLALAKQQDSSCWLMKR